MELRLQIRRSGGLHSMPVKLPPGISAGTFAEAVTEFQGAVGADWVFTSEEDLETYRDAYSHSLGHEDEYLASAAVAPGYGRAGAGNRPHREQVQDPARTRSPTGKNLTYGGSRAEYSRQRRARPQAHEPRARGRRQAQFRAGRTGRHVFRPVSPHPGAQAQGLDRLSGSRLGQPRSAMRWTMASATRLGRSATTSGRIAAWKSCCRTARSCAPAWAHRPHPIRGRNTSTASARMSTACSRRATSAS